MGWCMWGDWGRWSGLYEYEGWFPFGEASCFYSQVVACFSSVQSLSRVWLFATPWIAARQASLSITNSRRLLKLMSIESVCLELGKVGSSTLIPWKESYNQPRQHIKKQRNYFVNKGPSSQGCGFSSGHVWMWELDCEESWVPKNWCFGTVVLEKTLESPLDCKEIQPVHPKGDPSWMFIGKTDVEAETPILWPPDAKSWLIGKDPVAGKDWRQKEKRMTENEMIGWYHRLNGHEFE